MSSIDVTKDGITNTMVSSLEFAIAAFPVAEGYSHAEVVPEEVILSAAEVAVTAKDWRNKELKSSDWIVQIPDHPEKAAHTAYREKLRDWPSTSEFPATKPTLGS